MPDIGGHYHDLFSEQPSKKSFGRREFLEQQHHDLELSSRRATEHIPRFAQRRATKDVDLVATSTYPLARRSFRGYPSVQGKPLTFNDTLPYTISFDVLGLPAVSLPCGFSEEGVPVGLQLIGKAFGEPMVLRCAHAYKQATERHKRHPQL